MIKNLSKQNLLMIVGVIVVILVIILVFVLNINKGQAPTNHFESTEPVNNQSSTSNDNSAGSNSELPNITGQVAVEGQIICLPRRDTESPAIMLCTFGLKGDNGNYYALETSEPEDSLSSAGSNKVVVKGYFSPVEMLSSNIGKIYNIVGVIRVSSVEILETK